MSIAQKLTTIAENVPKVYEAGKKSEYDGFWDTFQENGNRKNYYSTFADVNSSGWTTETFRPKYDLKPENMQYMFYRFGKVKSMNLNLKQHLIDLGITLDTYKCFNFVYTFQDASISVIPYLDLSSATNLNATFNNCSVVEIDGMKVHAGITYNSTFYKCNNLESIWLEGEIGNSIDFGSCSLLTVESLRSILSALSKDSSYASGKTVTFNTASKAVIEADPECSEQMAQAVSAGWTVGYNEEV